MAKSYLTCTLLITLSALGARSMAAQVPGKPTMLPALSGKRVLLIMISRSNPQQVWLLTGRAQVSDSTFQVVADSDPAPIAVQDVDVQENAFEPRVLPHLVGDEIYLSTAEQLAREVARCIPMFVDKAPAGGKAVPGFLGGIATGPNGKIFLMQVR